jgi:hypothetical protein
MEQPTVLKIALFKKLYTADSPLEQSFLLQTSAIVMPTLQNNEGF